MGKEERSVEKEKPAFDCKICHRAILLGRLLCHKKIGWQNKSLAFEKQKNHAETTASL